MGVSNLQARTSRGGLFDRLQAWWHGYESTDPPEPAADKRPFRRREPAPGETNRWTGPRIVASERLFGDGFCGPGGSAWVETLLAPLALDTGAAVVDVRAGMGEITRTLVQGHGARVIGLEADPVLAAAGSARLAAGDLQDRAAIRSGTMHGGALARASCDVVIAREALFEETNKEDALRCLHAALRPGGQLLIADFVMRGSLGDSLDAEVWASCERTEPHLVPADEYAAILGEFGYEVLAVDDLSASYGEAIRQGLHGFADGLERQDIDPQVLPWIAWSVEYWARRARILESGDIGYTRLHARLPKE